MIYQDDLSDILKYETLEQITKDFSNFCEKKIDEIGCGDISVYINGHPAEDIECNITEGRIHINVIL